MRIYTWDCSNELEIFLPVSFSGFRICSAPRVEASISTFVSRYPSSDFDEVREANFGQVDIEVDIGVDIEVDIEVDIKVDIEVDIEAGARRAKVDIEGRYRSKKFV